MSKKIILGLIVAASLAPSCDQANQQLKKEADKVISQTSKSVQKVVDDFGLVYVEEGAQNIITYKEVNAAQQAWCDALVKIGKLKDEGGDYK